MRNWRRRKKRLQSERKRKKKIRKGQNNSNEMRREDVRRLKSMVHGERTNHGLREGRKKSLTISSIPVIFLQTSATISRTLSPILRKTRKLSLISPEKYQIDLGNYGRS